MSQDGTVFVNGSVLDEPYVTEKAYGECDITFPYQVPDERVFVMGDHRSVSIDSRSSQMGCVAEEQIVGRLVFRILPIKKITTF
jgi:signal peptidase I